MFNNSYYFIMISKAMDIQGRVLRNYRGESTPMKITMTHIPATRG